MRLINTKILLIALANLIVIILGCDDNIKYKTYSDADNYYSLKIPVSWELKKGDGSSSALISPPADEGGGEITIEIREIPEGLTLKNIVKSYILNLNNAGTELQITINEPFVKNDLKAWKIYYRLEVYGDLKQFVSYFYIYDNQYYIIICSVDAKFWSEKKPIFEHICESFRLAKPSASMKEYKNKENT